MFNSFVKQLEACQCWASPAQLCQRLCVRVVSCISTPAPRSHNYNFVKALLFSRNGSTFIRVHPRPLLPPLLQFLQSMSDIIQEKLSSLLQQAKDTHAQFEKMELGGQYDQQWAAWYADYLVTSGLPGLIGSEPDVDQLASQLNEIIQRHKAERTAEDWADYSARELLQAYS